MDLTNWTGNVDCSKGIHEVNSSYRCEFVKGNADCQDFDGFINYIQVLYCVFGGGFEAAGIVVYVMWLGILFTGLAISADDYFCPSLTVISRTLRLSHNVAGVTILAFGNGAPDIFSSLAGISQSRPELVLGELFGAGVFVTTVVAGSVCITRPFKLMERPFLRDITFYLAAGFWAFCIFYRGHIHLYDSLGFLGLYVVYIGVVLIGRYINQRNRRHSVQELLDQDDGAAEDESASIFVPHPHHNHHHHPTPVIIAGDSGDSHGDPDDSNGGPGTLNSDPANTSDDPDRPHMDSPTLDTIAPVRSPFVRGWRDFALKVNPIDSEDFQQMNVFKKVWSCIQVPVILVFSLTIPVVDDDDLSSSWCQYLHAAQAVVAPTFAVFAIKAAFIQVGSVHLWELTLMGGLALAILVLCTSGTDRPPFYHDALAFVGFVQAVIWIYLIANEIVSLLKCFGVVFGLSDAILGLTVLAWGNSIGDLIADVAISSKGFPRMGFSACFGGPLFNLLLGIGIPFTIEFAKNGGRPIPVDYNPMVLTLSISLASALIVSFIVLPLCRFRATRKYGMFLVGMYVALLAAAIVVEFVVVRPQRHKPHVYSNLLWH